MGGLILIIIWRCWERANEIAKNANYLHIGLDSWKYDLRMFYFQAEHPNMFLFVSAILEILTKLASRDSFYKKKQLKSKEKPTEISKTVNIKSTL